jgi:hypothetical protein
VIAALAALLLTPAAHAMEVNTLEVRFEDGRYIVELEARLDAPADVVGAVLTDFDHYPQLDERILESRLEVLEHQPPRLITRLRGCVGVIICRSMKRVESLAQRPGELIANAIPEESDVRFGTMFSRWEQKDGYTQVRYRLVIIPDFWVPPMIGRRMMIRTLREGTLSLFRNVERVARRRMQASG